MARTILGDSLLRASGGLVLALVAISVTPAAAAGQGPPAEVEVVTVPWLGNPNNDHQVFSGGSLVLQGVARLPAGCAITAATWDPGDGSGPVPIPFGNPRALELAHTYTGIDSQPYQATLSVTTAACGTASDTFRVRIMPRSLEIDVNMAIDRGLWNLHKRQILSSVGGVPTGYWNSIPNPRRAVTTASVVLAFEVNGHLETGDGAEDPYVDDVMRGLAHTFTDLSRMNIGVQPAGNPDSNGNGFALQAIEGDRTVYVLGQLVDAIVASNTPAATARTGAVDVQGRTYRDIVQDMMDAYSWGQMDAPSFYRGGWRYGWHMHPANESGAHADNSACQWWAIGGIAAERVFDVPIPQFVKDENRFWLLQSQIFTGSNSGTDGRFGYRNAGDVTDVAGMNTTPSGLVQLILGGELQTSPRFIAAERFMVRNWLEMLLGNRIYGMYAIAKSMRLALPTPIIQMGGTFDWYGSDLTPQPPGVPGTMNGLARKLVNMQQFDGSWDDGRWVFDDLASSWAIVVLSPTIIQLPPRAVCEMDAEVTAVGVEIEFDGRGSSHLDPSHQIVSWEWDFEDDGIFDASGEVVTHAYPTVGLYNTRLRVTDDNDPPLSDDSTCVVEIIPPPIPPDANPGGAYVFCIDINEQFVLDGTGSADPDGKIVSYGWEFSPQPSDNTFDDSTSPAVNVTAYFTALGPGFYDVALRVTDDDSYTNTDFTTVEVRDTGPCPPPGNTFYPFCIADGTDAPCPCGNNGVPGNGCANSTHPGGANLSASGHASLMDDTVILTVVDQHPGSLQIVIQGDQEIVAVPFGDGLRCIGGHLKRLFLVKQAHSSTITVPSGNSIPPDTDPGSSLSERSALLGDPLSPGDQRGYQVYYRDANPSFCPIPTGNTFNITNGVRILWGP